MAFRRRPNRIRVAFDGDIFLHQIQGGISRYFIRMGEQLPAFGIVPEAIAPLYFTHLLRQARAFRVIGRWTPWSLRKVRLGLALNNRLHKLLVRATGARIVHETYPRPYRLAPRDLPVVITIYDMIFELFPHIRDAEWQAEWKRAAIKRADRIICISQNTRADLIRFYPEVAERTTVIHLAVDDIFKSGFSARSPHPRPYLLYVGMRRDYKNFDGLVAAMASSATLKDAFDLVVVTAEPLSPAEQDMIKQAGLTGRVHLREAHGDAALRDWYHHAALFAYPSRYEGFGIPPIEAMAAGCPVVCLRVSSIPEVCGDAAEYAEPDAPESLRQALERVAFDPARADELRTLGRKRIDVFSWRECARQTSEVYKQLV